MRVLASFRAAASLLVTATLTATALQPAEAATMTARALLFSLPVAAEQGSAHYDRDRFDHWIDADDDRCDTREEVLIAESHVRATRTSSCTVTAGRWHSTYDGVTWTDPSDVDIDHVVALKEAWVSGARAWTSRDRRRFANDLGFSNSLAAVTDNVNASKGDRDPAEWLPARARCSYAIHWVQVKYRWRLQINAAEKQALSSLISGTCGARDVLIPTRAR